MIVETAAGRFAAERRGSGPAVVLLHSLALSGEMWDGLASHLASRFEVWSLDARGHGRSDWDRRPFTIEDLAGDLEAVLDALGLTATHLVGLSMGGSTALVFAASRPDRVGRLVVADTTASYGPDREAAWEQRARSAQATPRNEQLGFQLERWFSAAFRESNPGEVKRVADLFLRADSGAHAEACRALGALNAEDRLGDIRADTLVVVGSEDYATPPAMAQSIARRVPRARYREVPGVRHMSLVECPALWDEVAGHLGSPS
jgi:3-oxoadipate enol-lactonase